MKRIKIVRAIKKRYSKIAESLKVLRRDFTAVDVSRFIREVEKLRSLLGLIAVTNNKSSSVSVPKRLHDFYTAIGSIRNLQLQQLNMSRILYTDSPSFLDDYMNSLATEIVEQTALAKDLIRHKRPFKRGRRKLINTLTRRMKHQSIQVRTRTKIDILANLTLAPLLSDESLHAIYKLLKDISYSNTFTHVRTNLSTTAKVSMNQVLNIEKTLGQFQDQCMGIDLLHTHYIKQQTSAQERTAWRNLENKWWARKERTREEVQHFFDKEGPLFIHHRAHISNGNPHTRPPVALLTS